jgi:hypothetical protein
VAEIKLYLSKVWAGFHRTICVWVGLHINIHKVWEGFYKINSPLGIPSKLKVIFIKKPKRCLWKANYVKFKGVSLNFHECGLDYILISKKCEIFFVKLLSPEPPGWIWTIQDQGRSDARDFVVDVAQWGAKIPCGLGLLKKEIPLNRIVGPTNQNVWVLPDVGPTRISHESTWVPPKHIVGPAWTIFVVCGWLELKRTEFSRTETRLSAPLW